MKKVAIVGCGGINSWAVKHLREVVDLFDKDKLIFVKLFDNDVVEEKNLLRSNQNFEVEDLMKQKANVLAKRYEFDSENIFITEKNIDEKMKMFNDIILGVDNHKTRQIFYKYCLENNKRLFDFRAQGTQMAFYLLDFAKNMDYYNKKHFNNKEIMERKGSCQLTDDIENDNIQTGNKIIAYLGIYGVYLNHLRGKTISTTEWRFAY